MIQSSGGLSKEQIEKMVREGEQYAELDKKRRVRCCAIAFLILNMYDHVPVVRSATNYTGAGASLEHCLYLRIPIRIGIGIGIVHH